MDVKVFEKPAKNGKIALVMKWQDADGRPRQQKLPLFLLDAKTADAKLFNVDVKRQVEKIRLDKEVELLQNEINPQYPLFMDYYKMVEKMRNADCNTWRIVRMKLETFLSEKKLSNITTDKVTPQLLEDFSIWVANINNSIKSKPTKLAGKTVNLYISKLATVINYGIKKEMFKPSCAGSLIRAKQLKKEVDYLTPEEIKLLIENKYKVSEIYYGFLLAIYTGLRWSDVVTLKWKEVDLENSCIETIQQKTQNKVFIPISDRCKEVVFSKWFKSKDVSDLVFPTLKLYHASVTYHLCKWGKSAGIDKHLHFHISRHTLAVNLIEKDVDIYTVSKLLGHTSIKTTESHYSEVTLKRKLKAVDKLNF